MEALTRSFEARADDVRKDDRSIVSRINTSSVDRYKTIIQARGIDFANYRKNPVVLWEHGKDPQRGTMPIGRNLWIKSDGSSLIAKTQFRTDDYSQQLWEAYRDGDLRGWSVNVLPHDASPPDE